MDHGRPPFRADHVGSLLRPASLREAREKAEKGELTQEALRAVEDGAIRDVVALQESVGLQSITDGEFRRNAWHTDFLGALDGVVSKPTPYAVSFKDDAGNEERIATMLGVTAKIKRSRPIFVDHFSFLAAQTSKTAKISLPSPTYLHMRGGRQTVPATVYPDIEEFWADIVDAYRLEIRDLAAAGCRYLQLDDVTIAFLCDESIRAQVKADGEDPDRLPGVYADVLNAIVKDRPEGLSVTVHTCRGNHNSRWMAAGSYEAVAETVFSRLDVDGFFLEFDSERAGDFSPLRFMPDDKRVVLGLVSSKVPELERADDLKRRIDAASRFVPLENLCISPQCGFASTAVGNQLSEDDQRRKLELVVEVAHEVWGNG